MAIEPSRRDKGFITADASGVVKLHYGTSGKTLLTVEAGAGEIRAAAFAPKADGFLLGDGSGRLSQWDARRTHTPR